MQSQAAAGPGEEINASEHEGQNEGILGVLQESKLDWDWGYQRRMVLSWHPSSAVLLAFFSSRSDSFDNEFIYTYISKST